MKPNYTPPPPPPQNEFERLLPKMHGDPTVHGKALRALMALELHTLAVAHPELEGEHQLTAQSVPQLITFEVDAKGPFIAIFSSEAVVDWTLPQIPMKGQVGVVTMEAKALFTLLNNGKHTARVNFGMAASLTLTPPTIQDLVSGALTSLRLTEERERMQLFTVLEESLPPELVSNVRRFCDKRNVPIAVYAFLPSMPDVHEADTSELRFVLWLRSADNDFYNDFRLMVGSLMPEGFKTGVGVITEQDEEGMAFLQQCKPLWPVTE
jgi:hypothetical protein